MPAPKFKKSHLETYGLRITSRNAVTGAVDSVQCRFCFTFGREEKVGAKRKATSGLKDFRAFHTRHFMQHLLSQHPIKWSEYSAVTEEGGRDQFFSSVDVPHAGTISAHLDISGTLRIPVNKSIVEVIIGDMLFSPEDLEGLSHTRALSLFKLVEHDADRDNDIEDDYKQAIPYAG